MIARFAVFSVSLSVEHIRLGYLEVALGHERDLNLVLNLFNRHAVLNDHTRKNIGEVFFCCVTAY